MSDKKKRDTDFIEEEEEGMGHERELPDFEEGETGEGFSKKKSEQGKGGQSGQKEKC